MGKYINGIGTTFDEKFENLSRNHAAIVIPKPKEFTDNLVCLIDNGYFSAAVYCYDESEFIVFSDNDGRRKCWFSVPNANKLAR